jgi:hypothetical protein
VKAAGAMVAPPSAASAAAASSPAGDSRRGRGVALVRHLVLGIVALAAWGPRGVVSTEPADPATRVVQVAWGADSLVARVEGMSHGRLRGADFPYARVACP